MIIYWLLLQVQEYHYRLTTASQYKEQEVTYKLLQKLQLSLRELSPTMEGCGIEHQTRLYPQLKDCICFICMCFGIVQEVI